MGWSVVWDISFKHQIWLKSCQCNSLPSTEASSYHTKIKFAFSHGKLNNASAVKGPYISIKIMPSVAFSTKVCDKKWS